MCEGIVEKVKFPNKGIVKVEDSEVTVKNTLPGQNVSFVIIKRYPESLTCRPAS